MTPDLANLGLRWRQMRFNPLRSLTPERLASALDQHAAGYLREAALIFETIEQREAIVRSVMTKRRAAVARRDWTIVVPDPENPLAEAHKATLEHFYNNLTVTDATDLNVRTGMSGLLRQMMDAIIQRYAVHEIIWKPGADGLTAELRRVPLYFFENRSGKLRFTGPENRADGMPLEEDGWMVTVADGLGEALSICWMFKRLGIQDLLAFSEKFSVPGVLGRTTAAKGSDAGNAMRDSVLDYASEWVGIVYGDDGSIKDPVQIIQSPAGGSLPPMEIATYFDRMIATLVRGGDLSTISRDNGNGSNPQSDETDALLEDDCALVSETLQTQLDRMVIRMVHGDETPAAYIVIEPPATMDSAKELAIDAGLAALGVKQDPADLAERYGREVAEENAETLKAETLKEEKEKAAENYSPDQPRFPKGSGDESGEWTDDPAHRGNWQPKRYKDKKQTDGDLPPEVRGIRRAVEQYKILRSTGEVRAAKLMRDQIQKDIDKHKLDAKSIWGESPEESAFLQEANPNKEKSISEKVTGSGGKTRMEMILDEAEKGGEVRLSIEGDISREQVIRVSEAAEARGMTAAFDGSGFLIRKNPASKAMGVPSKPLERFDYMEHMKPFKVKPFKEADLSALYEKTVTLPDGRRGKVTSYNIGNGILQIMDETNPSHGTQIQWDRVKVAANTAKGKPTYYDPEQEAPDLAMQRLRSALTADLQPLGEALAGALQAGDEAAFRAALKKISARMPDFLESPELEALLQSDFIQAFTGEDLAENYNPLQPRNPRGEWTDGQGGGGGTVPQAESDDSTKSKKEFTFNGRTLAVSVTGSMIGEEPDIRVNHSLLIPGQIEHAKGGPVNVELEGPGARLYVPVQINGKSIDKVRLEPSQLEEAKTWVAQESERIKSTLITIRDSSEAASIAWGGSDHHGSGQLRNRFIMDEMKSRGIAFKTDWETSQPHSATISRAQWQEIEKTVERRISDHREKSRNAPARTKVARPPGMTDKEFEQWKEDNDFLD